MKPFIQPLGVGELNIVKQKLLRYEAGEIAHIENIMQSEERWREHKRINESEEVFEIEQEIEEENVRDLNSTERFELQTEAEKVIKSDTKFEAGAEVSVSYGSFLTVNAFANYSQSNSSTESNRVASQYAKEITERSLNKIKEKVREKRRTRTFERIEETNYHGFKNGSGNQHIAGIYRWVDKYYRAKVVNYGKRLMYEFIVPEPAAFYLFAQTAFRESDIFPSPPVMPEINGIGLSSPSQIDRANYLSLIAHVNAEGVEPPPSDSIVINKALGGGKTFGEDQFFSLIEEVKIPKGYFTSNSSISYAYNSSENVNSKRHPEYVGIQKLILITAGIEPQLLNHFWYDSSTHTIVGNGHPKGLSYISSIPLEPYINSLNIGIFGKGVINFHFNVTVTCTLNDETFNAWQIDTYNKIMNAYQKQVLDYEEKLAAAEIDQGVRISGNNPAINREIEREELKKWCIIQWLGRKIKMDWEMEYPPNSLFPDINPSITRADIKEQEEVAFTEEVFDWKNMTYEFLPYYFNNRDRWIERFNEKDNDPLFEKFLKAGAAKVIVPVHAKYTAEVLHFQYTGDVWKGGAFLPVFQQNPNWKLIENYLLAIYLTDDGDNFIYDENGNFIIDEIDIHEDTEISPQEEGTWEMKVPTNLVWLQQEGNPLPNFEP